jgi:putative cell wall binding repeat protein
VPVQRKRRLELIAASVLALAGAALAAYLLIGSRAGTDQAPSPAPAIVIREQQELTTGDLGFPSFATKNTTRVAGPDPAADAAGVALAVFPSTGGVKGPTAVSLVADDDWAGGIAVSSLTAPPIGAPVLVSGADDVPSFTVDALRGLSPAGSDRTAGKQAFDVGSASVPLGLEAQRVPGASAAAVGASVDRLRQRLTGADPKHFVVVSSEKPQFAMPAAGWAARSGDPVLFASRGEVPKPTLAALRRHPDAPVYILGPPSVISDEALAAVRKISTSVERIAADDPIQNAVAFARFAGGDFGWDINDPGHGFVIANVDRPLDAAAAAPLSAAGTWGPLLLTDDPTEVPPALREYLLDVKPGYVGNPTRAVYNHVWLIGGQEAISVAFQAQVDDLAELVQVRSGLGSGLGPPPGTPEDEQPQAGPSKGPAGQPMTTKGRDKP